MDVRVSQVLLIYPVAKLLGRMIVLYHLLSNRLSNRMARCLICGKELEVEFGNNTKQPWMGLLGGGNSWEVTCNYGSKFDTYKFIFCLCDECIAIKKDEGLIVPNGNVLDEIEEFLW
jgi:hypothetical protein